MGSLMGGWDSAVLDPKVARYQRNISLTRGEIEAFWRSHSREEDGNTSPSQSSQENTPKDSDRKNIWQERTSKASGRGYSRSSSMPPPSRRNSLVDDKDDEHEKLKRAENKSTSCWWTGSIWAFLNEPPVIETEGPQHRHAPKHWGAFAGSATMGGGHSHIIT